VEAWSRKLVVVRVQRAIQKEGNTFTCYEVTSEPTILQHGLPWRRQPETLSRVNYKQTLRVFLPIVAYRVIVGSLVTSLLSYESVNLFLNCPVLK
jgi:hypothetical protein